MRDFSIDTYFKLLKSLQLMEYSFETFSDFNVSPTHNSISLRHDVDSLPQNSLEIARVQQVQNIKGTFFFRAVPESWNEKVILEIYKLGHEIGYHYENITTCKGDIEAAIMDFEINLERLKQLVPVSTICMHGSPMSPFDSKELWKYVDYHNCGLEAEPYFDVDFSEVLYLTDTGRRWNGVKVNIRDKYEGVSGIRNQESGEDDRFADWKVKPPVNSSMNMTQEAIAFQNQYNFKSTFDIIRAAQEGRLPNKIMMTFHPQRWTDKSLPWMKELIWQNTKNVAKYFLIKMRQ